MANRASNNKGLSEALAQRPVFPSSEAATITTLQPEPLEVLRPIPVCLRFDGEDYYASFIEANVNSSGETHQEAMDGLRALLASTFRLFDSTPPEKLGPEPRRRLAVLRQFIRSRADNGTADHRNWH